MAPASVRLIARVVRLRSRTPTDRSSCVTRLLTIDFDKPRRRAAAEKLFVSTTAAKTTMRARSCTAHYARAETILFARLALSAPTLAATIFLVRKRADDLYFMKEATCSMTTPRSYLNSTRRAYASWGRAWP